jgi:plasmanylethanolamine desaturase
MSSPWTRAGEVASVAAFAALAARLAWRSAPLAAAEPGSFAAGALAGALAADLASGVVHWLCDRFGSERTPLFGPYLITYFREHHRDPSAIARHGFFERSGANAFAVVPLLALAPAAVSALPAPAGACAAGAALSLAVFVALTNEIHLQAHRARPARVARWLQRLRLVLPPDAHDRHHREGHDRAYCIATGWSNALLDHLGVFRRLERWLRRS